jgi:hypothetical protein
LEAGDQVFSATVPAFWSAVLQSSDKGGRLIGTGDGPIAQHFHPLNQEVRGALLQAAPDGFNFRQFRHGRWAYGAWGRRSAQRHYRQTYMGCCPRRLAATSPLPVDQVWASKGMAELEAFSNILQQKTTELEVNQAQWFNSFG